MRTDMVKLAVAFRNIAKAPTGEWYYRGADKPDQEGNKLHLSKVWRAEEWIDLTSVGTGGGLLWMR
jgi:hypothetical protein